MTENTADRALRERLASLEHLSEVLRAVRRINQLITKEKNRNRMLRKACAILVEVRGYFNAFVILTEDGNPIEPCFHAGFDGAFAPMAAMLRGGELPDCAQKTIAHAGPVVIGDPASECRNCPFAGGYHGRAGMTMRLEHAGHVYGWMSVSVPHEYAGKEDEQALFEEVCEDIAFALWSLQQEARHAALAEKYAAALETTTNAVISVDLEGRITLFNPGAEKLYGCAAVEALGTPVSRFCPPELLAEHRTQLDRVMTTGTLKDYETERLAVDGRRIPVEITLDATMDENGRVMGVTGILRDITERKQAEDALAASEEKYRALYENAPLSYQSLDEEGRFLDVNPAWLKTLGYEREEVIGRGYADFLHPDWRPHFARNFPEFKRRGVIHDVQFKLRHKQGHYLDVSFEGCVGYRPDGSFQQTYCVFKDITEQKQAEAALLASERKFREIFESTSDAIYIHDLSGRMLETNDMACRQLGYDREEILQLTPFTVDAGEHARKAQGRIDAVLAKGVLVFESLHRRKDGSLLPVEVHSRTIQYDDDVCILSVVRDVTERKRAEAARREMERELSDRGEFIATIVDHLPIGLAVNAIDTGRTVYMNRKFEEIYGWPEEEIGDVEAFFEKVYPDFENREKIKAAVLADIASGDPDRMTWDGMEITTMRGEKRMVYAKNIPLYGQNIMISTVQDITERRNLQARLQQAQKMEAIGSLAGGIAHDFNNILFPIVGLAEMLMEDLPAGTLEHDNAREIFSAGKRGSDLVKQILSFSRQTEQQRLPVAVQRILKEVIKLGRSTIPAYIEVVPDIQPDCGMVMADPTQIHQIAMNLITNAYHAVDPHPGRIEITLREVDLKRDDRPGSDLEAGRYARMTVTDTGSGIAPALLHKIFEPYFTTKAQGKGTGLGLAVVYGLVKEHDGDIEVLSEPGGGATFHVYLPLLQQPADAEVPPRAAPYETGSERILLVDDEQAIVRMETRMLESLGYTVESRLSSLEALEAFKARANDFDLVITDMTMPQMTGDRLARELIAIRPGIPVILCTGFSERIHSDQLQTMGVKGLLLKPIVKSDLAAMVRKALDDVQS